MTATTSETPARHDPLPGPGYETRQARAHLALSQAIQDHYARGVVTPCTSDPQLWDADSNPNGIEAEIKKAARLCRKECPVFELCEAFVATDPPVHGVVAGQFRRHPRDQRHYNRRPKRDLKVQWATEAGTDEEGQAA